MNESLPVSLYTADQVRELDRIAIDEFGIAGYELMSRAGKAAFEVLSNLWPELLRGDKSLQIFCGSGNNGGDGYVIAGLAKTQGVPVSVVAVKPVKALKGDARKAWSVCRDLGVEIQSFDPDSPVTGDIIVDAMLGTGLTGEVYGNYHLAIETINHTARPVLAIDIPSGLCADTGAVLGSAIDATATVTFIGMKQGLLTAVGPERVGKLIFASLDIPEAVYNQQEENCQRLDSQLLSQTLKKRPRHAHKGMYGSLLVIGGNYGMPGAVIMAAEAAMASGAGRVTMLTRSEHLLALAVRIPEVMAASIEQQPFTELVKNKDAIVIGPGLGQDSWARTLLKNSLSSGLPVIIDADALNLIAGDSQLLCLQNSPMILTPHPGEASKLLNISTAAVQASRFDAVAALKNQFGATIVLKGAGTLIASEEGIQLCASGNPGMAVAGMGDVLSGVLGALTGQGLSVSQASALGVWLHAVAGDELALEQGEIGMLATALVPRIRSCLNRLVAQEWD